MKGLRQRLLRYGDSKFVKENINILNWDHDTKINEEIDISKINNLSIYKVISSKDEDYNEYLNNICKISKDIRNNTKKRTIESFEFLKISIEDFEKNYVYTVKVFVVTPSWNVRNFGH